MQPPRVWGLIPRLASQMRMEQVNGIFSRADSQGFSLSLELLGCEAAGFQGEPGNFICRSASPQNITQPVQLYLRSIVKEILCISYLQAACISMGQWKSKGISILTVLCPHGLEKH